MDSNRHAIVPVPAEHAQGTGIIEK